MSNYYTLSFVLFCLTVHYVSGRNCYYSCDCDTCDQNITQQECPHNDDYCYFKNDTGSLSKGCVTRELSKSVCEEEDHRNCWFCSGDLCNTSKAGVCNNLSVLIIIASFLFMLTL